MTNDHLSHELILTQQRAKAAEDRLARAKEEFEVGRQRLEKEVVALRCVPFHSSGTLNDLCWDPQYLSQTDSPVPLLFWFCDRLISVPMAHRDYRISRPLSFPWFFSGHTVAVFLRFPFKWVLFWFSLLSRMTLR